MKQDNSTGAEIEKVFPKQKGENDNEDDAGLVGVGVFDVVSYNNYDSTKTMQALVYQGPGELPQWRDGVPRPTLQEKTDVIVRVHKTTICGTDLHILSGNVPTCKIGMTLGHEGIGHVVQVGSAVQKWRVGDRILISCITACGTCARCQESMYAFCENGGWELGNTIPGMQAEYARIPHADFTAHALPESLDKDSSPAEDAYVMASDILPTGFEIGLRSGRDISAMASIAIVGVGPVGLAALLSIRAMDDDHPTAPTATTAIEKCPRRRRRIFAIDLDENRLKHASAMGATDLIHNSKGDAVDQIMRLTNSKGVDYVVECIGLPVGWDMCQDMVAAGGQITILGVHGKPAMIKLEKLWQHNVSIHTGMVHCSTIPQFIRSIEKGTINAAKLISHRFRLSQMEQAYDHFKNAEQSQSLKVLITNDLF